MNLQEEERSSITEASLTPKSSNHKEGGTDTLESLFEAFADFGRKKNKEGININNVNKWFRQAGLMGLNGINSHVTGRIFSVAAGDKNRLDFNDFESFVTQVGREFAVPVEEIREMLSDAGKPSITGLRDVMRKYLRC